MATQEQQARAYAAANPKRDGSTWAGWCASLMYRYNRATVAYGNATAAGDAVALNGDVNAAPIGAVHYWHGAGGDGHVAQDMAGRGRMLFMASRSITESLGDAIGFVSFADYEARTNMQYRGWAMSYGSNPILAADDNGTFNDGPTPAPSPEWDFGQQYADQARIQAALAARGRYNGPIDGVWGSNTIKGIQTTCANVGYTGPIDGIPGPNTCHYVQVYAAKFGDYTGPIDSVLGPNSWNGFALGLERP